MKSLLGTLACLIWLLWSAPGRGAGLEDGIYAWTVEGDGPRVTRNDGAEIVLGDRLGPVAGEATIDSVRNDNSLFVLRLHGAGPVAKEAESSHVTLVVDGVCLGVSGRSERDAEGKIDLTASIHGDEVARKVAAHFAVRPRLRNDPGHRFSVQWGPEKASYQVGEPVMLVMEIRNTGQRPFTFFAGGRQRGPRDNQFRFLAYRSYGFGTAVPDTGDPTNFGGIGGYQTLKPGETFTRSVALDRWFSLKEPDHYRVTGLFELELHDSSGTYTPIWDDLAVGDCLVRVVEREGGPIPKE